LGIEAVQVKSANTQLIANDALEYFLLINDNTVADSTQTALAVFAKGLFIVSKSKCRGNHAVSVHLQKFKGQRDRKRNFVAIKPL
jgi:hypothetical protein